MCPSSWYTPRLFGDLPTEQDMPPFFLGCSGFGSASTEVEPSVGCALGGSPPGAPACEGTPSPSGEPAGPWSQGWGPSGPVVPVAMACFWSSSAQPVGLALTGHWPRCWTPPPKGAALACMVQSEPCGQRACVQVTFVGSHMAVQQVVADGES